MFLIKDRRVVHNDDTRSSRSLRITRDFLEGFSPSQGDDEGARGAFPRVTSASIIPCQRGAATRGRESQLSQARDTLTTLQTRRAPSLVLLSQGNQLYL